MEGTPNHHLPTAALPSSSSSSSPTHAGRSRELDIDSNSNVPAMTVPHPPTSSSDGADGTAAQQLKPSTTTATSAPRAPPPPPPAAAPAAGPALRINALLFQGQQQQQQPQDSSTSSTTASQALRGFWKKTVETTATQAHVAWTNRQQKAAAAVAATQQQSTTTSTTTSPTPPHASSASAAPAVLAGLGSLVRPLSTVSATSTSSSATKSGKHNKIPLIQVTELEQAALSPSNLDGAGGEGGEGAAAGAGGAPQAFLDDSRDADEPQRPGIASDTQDAEAVRPTRRRSSKGTSEDEEDDHDDDHFEEDSDDEEETASYVSSSAYSTSYVSSDAAGNKFAALQWAAASVVDSVQSGYFRGRYANSSSSTSSARGGGGSNPGSRRGLGLMGGGGGDARLLGRGAQAGTGSSAHGGASHSTNQTARILSSSQAQHMREMLDKLAPHEYIMFLGRGMLGVNLKQSYLLKTGVYVDYLIPDGAAERSRLIQVGDLLTRVGELAVERLTILTIPQQIAASKRPLHLVWATGTFPGVDAMNPVEIAVAHMQRWRSNDDSHDPRHVRVQSSSAVVVHDQASTGGSAASCGSPPSSPPRSQTHDGGDAAAVIRDKDEEKKNDASPTALDDSSVTRADESFASESESPPLVEHPDVTIPALRSIEDFCNPGIPPLPVREAYHPFAAGRNQGFSVMHLCQCAATDDNFRNALQHAFVLCAVDDRRFPFLSKHLGLLEEEDDRPYNSPSALLMLFVEMVGYADLYDVTPEPRRLQIANRLAHKFFLPTRLGNELLPPMFDFHQIVPDSTLRALEASLRSDAVHRDLFGDFCHAAMESLSSHPFITFLVSADCARMRAYLRNTSLFVNVPLHRVFDAVTSESTDPHAQNYFNYVLLYLLCQTDREGYGEYDEQLSTGNGARCKDSAASLCAAVYIRRKLVPEVRKAQEDEDGREGALLCWERLWEIFLAPHVGALSLSVLSNEAASYLSALVSELNVIRTTCADFDAVMSRLCSDAVLRTALALADELMYSYASTVHSKFREHKFHEWLCREFTEARKVDGPHSHEEDASPIPRLPDGCVKRLLRRATYPIGVAPHKPFIKSQSEAEEPIPATRVDQVNAECAVVFGSRVGLFDSSNTVLMDDSSDPIRRYASAALYDAIECPNALSLDEIPPTLESYAVIPYSQESMSRPFKQYRDGVWHSSDGWEVSLVTFRIPRGESAEDSEDAAVYGVSLVFRANGSPAVVLGASTEIVHDPSFDPVADAPVTFSTGNDQEETVRIQAGIQVDMPLFNEKLKARPQWSERVSQESWQSSTIGLALLSRRNVVLAMRDTLSSIAKAFSYGSRLRCGPLVDLLGTFAHEDVEPCALQAILSTFLARAATPWLERPISWQATAFEQEAGRHLLLSLPPVPLALVFVTAMLEQKIVIASSRRSILLSASVALSKMLQPLSWCHLSVPRVPAALAPDLMQYPAPFILGIPSEDPGMMELIRELPEDVTLVDLDIGRVLLAQSFSHVEFGRGTPNNPKTIRALRSQVLYLAQVLGGVFGSVSNPEAWSCDRPFGDNDGDTQQVSSFDKVCKVCRDFLTELLSGTASCSYWIEESCPVPASTAQEPTVVFDEDRFFHIKSMRHRHGFQPLYDPDGTASRPSLSVSLSDFELVVEVLMQSQSMNAYIASCDKETMVYAR